MEMKRGRPPIDKPKRVRLSAYVDEDIAKIVYELANIQTQSVSEYLSSVLMMYLGRYAPDELKSRYF